MYPPASPPPSNPNSTWKVIKIGCSIMLVFAALSILGFYWVCNTLMDKSEEYENTLTELTGVFHSQEPVAAPLTGDSAVAVRLEFDVWESTGWGRNSSRSDDYDVLVFAPSAKFESSGKSYTIIGTRPFRLKDEVQFSSELSFLCTGRGDDPPEIPQSLMGLDSKTDERINKFRNKDCGFGVDRSSVKVREYHYTSSDTLTIKAFLFHDTIFLYQ